MADHPPVGLNLGFARAAEETETTALPLKVGPAAHQPALLVIQMGQFDLQSPFRGRSTLAEYLKDQAGPVDDLSRQLVLEIALLDRAEGTIHHDKLGIVLFAGDADVFHLPRTEQEVRLHIADRQDEAVGNDDTDRHRKPLRFLKPAFGVKIVTHDPDIRADDKGPRTARDLAHQIVIETQCSSSSQSSLRSTGVAGWIVDTACL